jgi:hypothetical protein
MRCMACGAEMRLMSAVPDETLMVPGYEHHTLQCMGCNDIERRLVFNRERAAQAAEPVVEDVAPPVSPEPANANDINASEIHANEIHANEIQIPAEPVAPPPQSAWRRAVAMFRGRQAG